MTPAQLRQARALLQLSQGQAAKLGDLPSHVLIDYERHGIQPSARQGGPARIADLREKLRASGVDFFVDAHGNPAVRLRSLEADE